MVWYEVYIRANDGEKISVPKKAVGMSKTIMNPIENQTFDETELVFDVPFEKRIVDIFISLAQKSYDYIGCNSEVIMPSFRTVDTSTMIEIFQLADFLESNKTLRLCGKVLSERSIWMTDKDWKSVMSDLASSQQIALNEIREKCLPLRITFRMWENQRFRHLVCEHIPGRSMVSLFEVYNGEFEQDHDWRDCDFSKCRFCRCVPTIIPGQKKAILTWLKVKIYNYFALQKEGEMLISGALISSCYGKIVMNESFKGDAGNSSIKNNFIERGLKVMETMLSAIGIK
jgi:hypothetical protein